MPLQFSVNKRTKDPAFAVIGSTPNAEGASVAANVITLQPASATLGGVLDTLAQSIKGTKTFVDSIGVRNLAYTWPAAQDVGPLVNDGAGVLSWGAHFWAKIVNSTVIGITANTTATANRLHLVSGTSADYDIPMPVTPAAGDVVGFIVREHAAASKQFRLDATGSVVIAGRTRYLTLLHSNVALFYYDGTRWLPLVLELDTPWVDAGAMTITATTTSPTKGTTTVDNVYWRRVGGTLEQDNRYRQTTAGTAGSGTYVFSIAIGVPSSMAIKQGTTGDSVVDVEQAGVACIGYGAVTESTTYSSVQAHLRNDTTFILARTNDTGRSLIGPSYSLANTIIRLSVKISIPMADW